MISISHAPNTTKDQQALALSMLAPWHWRFWRKGSDTRKLEQEMSRLHNEQHAVSFSTGREALYAILQACGVTTGDEVIIQAFTCIVVPNAIVWAGATPIYADIDHTLNIDPNQVEPLITAKTKAVIVQHTFGVPADVGRIRDICKRHKLLLIEDCAHALGATVRDAPVGTFGDAALFSFGRDKIISSVAGGMAMTPSSEIAQRLREIQTTSPQRSRRWIMQNLLHPLLVPLFARWMNKLKIGELFLTAAQKLKFLNRVYTADEKHSIEPAQLTHRLPNVMAAMALQQLTMHLQPFHEHRQSLTAAYEDFFTAKGVAYQRSHANSTSACLRYTIFVENRSEILAKAAKRGYRLGDWYNTVIMPQPTEYESLGYRRGSCPRAETFARTSLNLPTHPRMTNTEQQTLLNWLSTEL